MPFSDNRKASLLSDFCSNSAESVKVRGIASSLVKLRLNLTLCSRRKAKFGCLECGSTKELLVRCYIRICKKCEKARKYRLSSKYNSVLPLFKHPKLLTLTFRGYSTFNPIKKKAFDRKAYYFFRRFRQWIKGGIRVMELKKHEEGYFVHYHAIIEAPYLSQKRLSRVWQQVTGDSFRVDIRKIRGKWALKYVLKYATKPVDYEIDKMEYLENFYRTRLVTMFGHLYGWKVNHKSSLDCEDCGFKMVYFETTEPESIVSTIQKDLLTDYG